MRVLHLIDSGGLYGAERVLLSLVEEQRRIGIAAAIVSIGEPGIVEKPLERAAREIGTLVHPFRMLPGPNPVGALRLLGVARRERADVLHSHGFKANVLLAFLPRRWRCIPMVSTLHGYTGGARVGRMRLYEWADRRALGRMDRVVLVHGGMLRDPRLARLRDSRWSVIENGIDLDLALEASKVDEGVARFCAAGPTLGAVG